MSEVGGYGRNQRFTSINDSKGEDGDFDKSLDLSIRFSDVTGDFGQKMEDQLDDIYENV